MSRTQRITAAVAMCVAIAAAALAQNPPERSVSGTVVGVGGAGFTLQGPDGRYQIQVTPTTVIAMPMHRRATPRLVRGIAVGENVTAQGFPTGQWSMRAIRVIIHSLARGPIVRTNPPPIRKPQRRQPKPGADRIPLHRTGHTGG